VRMPPPPGSRRPPRSVAAVLALLLAGLAAAGCSSPATSHAAPADAAPADAAPADAAPADAASGDAALAAEPEVPPLHPVTDHLDETVVTVTTSEGDPVRVDAKVAVTDTERQRGLMEVQDLPPGVGMLFVYDDDRTKGFWMHNTLVPLDIAYIEADGRIGTILAMDPCVAEDPSDCEGYPPPHPYRTALEVPQGWFAAQGVAAGDLVTWTDPVPAGAVD
jgi:uncharacterized protein